jgi:hypothetical protein
MRWRLIRTALLGPAVVILALGRVAFAQTGANAIELKWTVETSPQGGWTVGDHIPLRLTATFPAGIDVTLPEFPQDWDPFEVQEQSLSKVSANADGTRSVSRSVKVTVWAPGEYRTLPVTVRFKDTDNQLHEILAPQLAITVISVLENRDAQKRDLKAQATLTPPSAVPWVLGGLLLATIMGALAWVLVPRMRRHVPSPAPVPHPGEWRSPTETAHTELDRISALDLPLRGELEQHYSLVADCMRKYAEERYAISAMDQTTDELTSALRRAQVSRLHVGLFHNLLSEADLVKFARFRPSMAEAQGIVVRARQIVDETRADRSSGNTVEGSTDSNEDARHPPGASRLDPDQSTAIGHGSQTR